MRLVVMPQAIKVILPALGNQFVYVLKMPSLISVIGLQELTRPRLQADRRLMHREGATVALTRSWFSLM